MTRYRLATLLVFAVLSLLVVVSTATAFDYASDRMPLQTGDSAAIAAAVQRNFGEAVEVVSTFNPYQVTGDFNGDGLADLAVVVRMAESRAIFPKAVKLLNPFQRGATVRFPRASDSRLALAILHDWKNPAGMGRFLLLGESPILILQNARATSNEESDRSGLLSIRSRSTKRRAAEPFPRTAKGDVVLLGTEVGGDSLLYWNGRTYLWEDSSED